MAFYESQFAVRYVPLTNASWTDLTGNFLPIDCNNVEIVNDSGLPVFFRTDPNNADSQVTIYDGTSYMIGAQHGSPGFRFSRGALLGSLKCASAQGGVSVKSHQ